MQKPCLQRCSKVFNVCGSGNVFFKSAGDVSGFNQIVYKSTKCEVPTISHPYPMDL